MEFMERIGQHAAASTHARLGEAMGTACASLRLGKKQRADKAGVVLLRYEQLRRGFHIYIGRGITKTPWVWLVCLNHYGTEVAPRAGRTGLPLLSIDVIRFFVLMERFLDWPRTPPLPSTSVVYYFLYYVFFLCGIFAASS